MSAEVEKILANEWPSWSDRPPELIRPLTRGLTNRSFLIQAGEEKLVLRINTPHAQALDLNRQAEAEALIPASERDLCAPLVYLAPDYRYLLTRFISGVPLDLNQPCGLAQLAQLLRNIHRLPPISAHLEYADKVQCYRQSIDRNLPFSPALARLHQKMQPLLQQPQDRKGLSLCHNDLLLENLLLDDNGRLRAIDWEYAACGDPFFDLAVICEGNGFAQHQREILLREYLQRPPVQQDHHSLHQGCLIYRYLDLLWYAVQFSTGRLSEPQHAAYISTGTHTLSQLALSMQD
ncbi:phosphotransferase [Microbulbifer pacificus]|uniref:phosphotransferase n=1 Tax=Microbulbifer pacificus TaxID=407164 RepID=UPI000CF408C3|nr:phosphotransferase [Microbulbifer pacificus]